MVRLLTRLVERPIGVTLVLLAVVGLGLVSLLRLPVSAMPVMSRPVVRLEGRVPGAGMEQLEANLVPRLERRLLVLSGVDSVVTWCRDGRVATDIAFRWGVVGERARLAVAEAVDGLLAGVAPVAGTPLAGTPVAWQVRESSGERPALLILINGSQPLSRRTALAEDVLLPALAAIPGVARAELLGGSRQRIVITPDGQRLAASGVLPGRVREALADQVRHRRIGRVAVAGEEAELVVAGLGDDPATLGSLAVPLPAGGTVALQELAGIERRLWSDHGVLRMAGTPTVGLALSLAADANALQVDHRLHRTLTDLQGRLAEGVVLERTADSLHRLRSALAGLLAAAGLGALVAGLVLSLFIRRPAPLALLLLVIPLSLCASLPAFEALGLGLNLVSLAGMALSAGMLVDAAVVVLDACFGRSGSPRQRAVEGTAAVSRAIIASAVTTVVVFVPALYLHHLAAALFRQLAVALIVTLLASLAFGLLALPVAVARLAPQASRGEGAGQRLYRRLLCRTLAAGWWAPVAVLLCIVGCSLLVVDLPQQLLAAETATASEVRFVLAEPPAGDDPLPSLDRLLAPLRQAGELDLLAVVPQASSGPPLATGFWRLPVPRTAGQLALVQEALRSAVPGLTVRSAGPAGTILDALPLRRLTVQVSGRSRPQVEQAAEQTTSLLRRAGMPVLADLPGDVPTLQAMASGRGRQVAWQLEEALAAALPAVEQPDLGSLRLDEGRLGHGDLTGLPVVVGGATLPLGTLAELVPVRRPAALVRHDGQPAVRLVVGEATGDVAALEQHLQRYRQGEAGSSGGQHPATGVVVRAGGGAHDWWEARGELILAGLLGLALVVLVLAALYESLRLPLVVLAVLPFAVLGGLCAQRLSGGGLDLGSGLGLVLLCGLAVNNGVLLLDRLRGCRGGPAWWARRASRRLRPVLVTTLTTLATLAPVAFVGGAGAALRVTLARTVFAGLLLSAPAALLILPPLARLLEPSESSR